MKNILAVCLICITTINCVYADRPPTYDVDCVNSKLTTVFDGDVRSDNAVSLRTGECALHGEFYTAIVTYGNPQGGNMATWRYEFAERNQADAFMQKKTAYIDKWKAEPNFFMTVNLISTAF